MMSLWSRIKLLFEMGASSALDRAEDPRQLMDYAFSQQKEFLRKVRQGLIEVAASKHQLEQQLNMQQARIPQLESHVKRAVAAGREDLARFALQRRMTITAELVGLERQLAEVAAEEQKLIIAEQQISARIEDFRTHRQTVSSRYAAAEAQIRINEQLTGVSGELGDLSMALGRAEEKTRRVLARASALDALIESGALEQLNNGGDIVERELREISAGRAVEEELTLLRGGESQPMLIRSNEGSAGE